MNTIYLWLVAYLIPVLAGGVVIKLLPKSRHRVNPATIIVASVTIIVSIFISQYFIYSYNLVFPWHPKVLSLAACFVSILIAAFLIGRTAIWYVLFVLIQELALTSITFLLLPTLPFYWIIFLIVPFFVWGHDLRTKHWPVRITLLALWGAIAIFLFSVFRDVYILVALHTFFGAVLISRAIIYPED